MFNDPVEFPESAFKTIVLQEGGASKFARRRNISRQVVHVWLRQGFVPIERAIELETQYKVPRTDLIDPKFTTPFMH